MSDEPKTVTDEMVERVRKIARTYRASVGLVPDREVNACNNNADAIDTVLEEFEANIEVLAEYREVNAEFAAENAKLKADVDTLRRACEATRSAFSSGLPWDKCPLGQVEAALAATEPTEETTDDDPS